MVRSLESIAADMNTLAGWDFDDMNVEAGGPERLQALCDELREHDDPDACAPILFGAMERLADADLGSPGPIVHTLEHWTGAYQSHLAASIRRKPSPLAVWMVNRVLNTDPGDAPYWLALLASIATHPEASDVTKDEAADFLAHQTTQGGD